MTKMPAEEETYINIDCLDEQTGEVLPLCKEEKHKVSPEELEARKNNFFMKIWNPLSGLVITIWKYLLRILNIIWGYIKKAGIFLKNRYVELKNKREKNKVNLHSYKKKTHTGVTMKKKKVII